jgi:hypothetical protein
MVMLVLGRLSCQQQQQADTQIIDQHDVGDVAPEASATSHQPQQQRNDISMQQLLLILLLGGGVEVVQLQLNHSIMVIMKITIHMFSHSSSCHS